MAEVSAAEAATIAFQRGVVEPLAAARLQDWMNSNKKTTKLILGWVEKTKAGPPTAEDSPPVGLADVFGETEGAGIATGFLQGALLELIRSKQYDAALQWLERINGVLPEDRKGQFHPLEKAALFLRRAPEDARTLDSLAPEVREVVDMILREVSKAQD